MARLRKAGASEEVAPEADDSGRLGRDRARRSRLGRPRPN